EFQVSSGKAQPANSVILSGVSKANGVEGPLSLRGTSPAGLETGNSQLETASIVRGIKLRDGRTVRAQAVIITTGTFLNGLIHCGEQQYPAGRSGEPPAVLLGESLKALGLR